MMRPVDATALAFSETEKHALGALRQRFHENRDLYSDREQAHLAFLRWLYRTGRFVPAGRPGAEGGDSVTPIV